MPVLFCAIGAALFILSDSLIVVDKFFVPLLTYRTPLIMITYYLAQLGITLSILEIKPVIKSLKGSSN